MERYAVALQPWAEWMRTHRDDWERRPLPEAHDLLLRAAAGILPTEVPDA